MATITDYREKVRYLMRMGRTECEARRIADAVDAIPVSHY
mgnify:CR=1 FL=1